MCNSLSHIVESQFIIARIGTIGAMKFQFA